MHRVTMFSIIIIIIIINKNNFPLHWKAVVVFLLCCSPRPHEQNMMKSPSSWCFVHPWLGLGEGHCGVINAMGTAVRGRLITGSIYHPFMHEFWVHIPYHSLYLINLHHENCSCCVCPPHPSCSVKIRHHTWRYQAWQLPLLYLFIFLLCF